VVVLVGAVGGLWPAGTAAAYPPPKADEKAEREVKPAANLLDSDKLAGPDNPNSRVWALDFRFKDPRVLTLNIPGRGQRTVVFLWYQVSNNTGLPRTFIPEFELKAHDLDMVYRDEVSPTAEAPCARRKTRATRCRSRTR